MAAPQQPGPCPVCASARAEPFVRLSAVPVHVGVVWPTREAAVGCARGEIALVHCPSCHFIQNVAFDDSKVDYGLRYDNALHFSRVFRDYEESLARDLVERHGVRGRHVIELGCGSGHFLGLVCAAGGNRGTGFDPSHDPEHADPSVGGDVRVVRDFYGEDYADVRADLVVCRHVLEHVPDPVAFLGAVRRAVSGNPDAVLYFEVPNAYLALRQLSIWDVVYEHTLYFVPGALEHLFRRCGLEVLEVRETYGGQFVGIEARPGGDSRSVVAPARDSESDVGDLTRAFSDQVRGICGRWRERLAAHRDAGERVALWGGGAKTVSFLNWIDGTEDSIGSVVDINPGKQGSFVAGTGHEIAAPERLLDAPPDVVVVMNPVYRNEIEASLSGMGLMPTVVDV